MLSIAKAINPKKYYLKPKTPHTTMGKNATCNLKYIRQQWEKNASSSRIIFIMEKKNFEWLSPRYWTTESEYERNVPE